MQTIDFKYEKLVSLASKDAEKALKNWLESSSTDFSLGLSGACESLLNATLESHKPFCTFHGPALEAYQNAFRESFRGF